MTTSIAELDDLELCDVYSKLMRPKLLKLAGSDCNRRLSPEVLVELVRNHDLHIVDLATPLVRLAREDPELRTRLTLFFNDLATRRLPDFEEVFPNDNRPRAAIAATRQLAAGALTMPDWYRICSEGSRSWASYYAPDPLITDAEWASIRFMSWSQVSPDFAPEGEPWDQDRDDAAWAIWSAFTMKIYFYRPGKTSEGSKHRDEKQLNSWATDRLIAWLTHPDEAPIELPPAPADQSEDCPATAARIDQIDMDWSNIIAFPHGLKHIDEIMLHRNASLMIPEGVRVIGRISMDEHPHLELPGSVEHISELYVGFRSTIDLPEGLKSISSLTLSAEPDNLTTLPTSIRYIGRFDGDADDRSVREESEEEGFWKAVDEWEATGSSLEYDFQAAALLPGGRRLIRRRRDIFFRPSENGLEYTSTLLREDEEL